MSFNALIITKEDETASASIQAIDASQLPEGDVVVDIDYSTLNYKDGLAITGKAPVVRKYPMVPGIDFAGTVSVSSHPKWSVGDKVILNGWGVGEAHWGGLAQGMDFPATVAPFILRGITLAGIDSVNVPTPKREAAWQRLAEDLNPALLEKIVTEITLSNAIEKAGELLDGNIRGRVIVDVNA